MRPIDIPAALDDATLLTIEEFYALAGLAMSAPHGVYERESGPRFWRFNGTGRLYTTVGEVRRSLAVAGKGAEKVTHHE